jgi:hypothetical protein
MGVKISLILGNKHRLSMYENGVLRIFCCEDKEVVEGLRKLLGVL